MNKPKISVIVPVYNVEKYLHRCVDSILEQTFTDFELLLIDDGSKDKSGVICDDYVRKDKRVRVFHKANGGVSSARNVGLNKALGEYITFIDADDYFIENTFSAFLFDKGYDLIQIPRNDGSFIKTYSQDIECDNNADFLRFTYRNFYFECWGRFYKREIIGDSRFDERITIGEDLLFFLDVYSRVNFFHISSTSGGYHYSYVPTSAMHKKNLDQEQLLLANCVYAIFKNKKDILAGVILIDYFYNRKVCSINHLVKKLSIFSILKLPLSLKAKVKFLIRRFLLD